jgi:cobaltochelatase CobT
MPKDDNPLEAFRQVLTGASRAIAAEPELEVGFTAEAPSVQGKSVKVPMPGRTLAEREVAEARGHADAAALKLRHHDAGLHARRSPGDEVARAVFNAAEQARVEALGARAMAASRRTSRASPKAGCARTRSPVRATALKCRFPRRSG